MSETNPSAKEKLVVVHKARDEWEADLIVGYLRDNGIEAMLSDPPSRAAAGFHAGFCDPDTTCPVYVLEEQTESARQRVGEFLAARADEPAPESNAPAPAHLDRARIAELRESVKEERRTFEFLGWGGVVFLAAGALLWTVWPSWLKMVAPTWPMRSLMVILLVLAAVFVGSWSGRRLR